MVIGISGNGPSPKLRLKKSSMALTLPCQFPIFMGPAAGPVLDAVKLFWRVFFGPGIGQKIWSGSIALSRRTCL